MEERKEAMEKNGLKAGSTAAQHTMRIVYCAFFTVIITVSTYITVPFVIPFTMQTFAVFFTLLMLGGRYGTASICLYVLLGAAGVPVFSGFKGGPAVLLGTTGGYILGFILTGLVYWLSEAVNRRVNGDGAVMPRILKYAVLILGLAICYFFGTVWFMKLYLAAKGPVTVGTVLGWCVLPFIIPDMIKLLLAAELSKRLKKSGYMPRL